MCKSNLLPVSVIPMFTDVEYVCVCDQTMASLEGTEEGF